MKSELYTTLFSLLSSVAAEKDYLENLSEHSDAIHWHLNKIEIDKFEELLQEYFSEFLKTLRKKVSWDKITIAFDETFVPFYGKAQDNWVVGYKNKIKGATGSYKFMVCSIVVQDKRFVLHALPMHNNSNTDKIVLNILDSVRAKFRVETVLFDRGFCHKKLCRDLEERDMKYLILTPKWKNIQRYMNSKETEIVEVTKISEYKTKNKFSWRFVFAYDEYNYDWSFATNLQVSPHNLVKLYKCRWGIETNFRIMDLAEIKSKSKNIVTRCFFFLISILLFNSWLNFDQDLTFESYLDALALASISKETLLEKYEKAKALFNLKNDEIITDFCNSVNIAMFSQRFPCWKTQFQPCMNQAET